MAEPAAAVVSTPPPVLDAFAAEVEALGQSNPVGEEDVRSLYLLKRLSMLAEIFGRVGLVFAPEPVTFGTSVALLVFHLGIESQLNHSIQHGAYSRVEGAEDFARGGYETLALPLQTKTWRDAHRIHHSNPSLLGRDPDTEHPLFRVHPKTERRWWHALNGILGTFFVFELWGRDYDRFLKDRGRRESADRSELWKLVQFVAYQFLLFPLLAGPAFGKVFLGTLIAVLIRNFIFVGLQTASSVGESVSGRHAEAFGRKAKGDWYKFQVETSKNYRAPALWTLLSGGLDRHIEHHLFPRLPPMRLRQLSPQVRELCEKYGVTYEEHGTPWASLWDSVRWLARLRR